LDAGRDDEHRPAGRERPLGRARRRRERAGARRLDGRRRVGAPARAARTAAAEERGEGHDEHTPRRFRRRRERLERVEVHVQVHLAVHVLRRLDDVPRRRLHDRGLVTVVAAAARHDDEAQGYWAPACRRAEGQQREDCSHRDLAHAFQAGLVELR
jgi:hypothetical protein